MMILKWMLMGISLIGLAKTDTTINLDGTQLDITRKVVDGVSVLNIEGSGMYQFTHQFGDESRKYSFNSVTTSGDDFLIEGYTIHHDTRTYDPFFVVIAKDGTLVLNELFESPLQQDLMGAYPLVDGYLLHLRTSEDNGYEDFEFTHDELHILGDSHTQETFREKITEIKKIDQGYHVFLNFEDIPSVYVRNNQTLYLDNRYDGIKTDQTYTDQVTLHFAGEALLNGETVIGPVTVVQPGKYTWTMADQLIHFTLDPKVTGILPGAIKASDVRIEYTYGQGTLNGDYYAPGEKIVGPGEYIFGIYEDNYAYEIPFKITARIEGVEHLKTYDEPVVIHYHGEGYLNNEFLESGSEVSENGTYTFKVFGDNGYLELVTFKIESEPTLSPGDWIERSLLGGSFCLAGWFFIREFRRTRKRSTTP